MTRIFPAGFHTLPLPIAQLSLAAVLKCGQSFRWSIFPLSANPASPEAHEYRLCLRDRVVCLRQSFDMLFYRSVFPEPFVSPSIEALKEAETLSFLKDYFQLDIDLVNLYEQWSTRDPVFNRFKSRFGGIRVLRQDPWENLVSFICSSNNNISRITKMVQSLCKQYSPALLSLPDPPVYSDSSDESKVQTYHPFPPPSILAAPEVDSTLRSLGFGYRAKFIQRTAKILVDTYGYADASHDPNEPSEKWLMTLRSLSTAEARKELLKFIGVGRKVADCVLLMSLDKREVIPVDTHILQIALKHYSLSAPAGANMTPALYERVNTRLVGVWGDFAGWAHAVLFTADLKSFSSYGISAPLLSKFSTEKRRGDFQPQIPNTTLPVPPLSVSPCEQGMSPVLDPPLSELTHQLIKKDANNHVSGSVDDINVGVVPFFDLTSLADRVKRRRRAN